MRIYVRDIGEHPGGLQVDCNIRRRNESKVGGVSRDGVQRKMKGSYGYSVSRNTRNRMAGKSGGSFKELRGHRGPRVVGSTEATTARERVCDSGLMLGGKSD
jgi:hypothetical protein